jgi:hypothetical protein
MRAAALAALVLALPVAALAQPMMGAMGGGMPNLKEVVGRPLPDAGMATGTVSVRVSRRMPGNAVAGAEVAAIIKTGGGELRRRTEKTDANGRVIFEGMVPGDEFHAEVTVDGEKLETQTFTMPSQGGLRTMLIAALGAAPAGGGAGNEAAEGGEPAEGGGEPPAFALGSTAGVATGDSSLPVGRLDVHILDEEGAPIPHHLVTLGMVDKTNKISVRKAESDANGVAHFSDLPHGDASGYAAVLDWHGMRLGTAPFPMPALGGARAEIRALTRTSDPSVVTIGEGSRVIIQMHEDSLQFLEILPLENTSDKIFDPGPGAVEIPLPQGFVGAEAQEGERKIDVRQNHGMAVHGTFSPRRSFAETTARNAGQEVVFGFVLPYHSDTREFVQPMPTGMGRATLITEQSTRLSANGPGIGAPQARDLNGKKYWVMPIEAIPRGGTLSFTITGIPFTDTTGRIVAGILALGLVGAAIVFGRRPRAAAGSGAGPAGARDELIERRESTFAELVALERDARAAGSPPAADLRRQIVSRLEQIYRDLAALDERQAA